jgi:2-polyprenyl-3-methyl-5-hydroxy-6-metoxy-1,4-benzoquinol methylase
MPLEEDVLLAYQKYYTHDSAQADGRVSFRRRISGLLDRYYLSRKYGYDADGHLWMKWAGAYRSFQPLRSARLDFSVMYLPSNAGARLLEVGCGGGETLRTLLDHGWLAEGVDFDPVAVAVAGRRGLQVRQGTLEEQHYPDASFDAITMSHLVEHVHDPVKLLAECGRILKPGGSIVVVTPNVSSLGHRFYRSAWRSLDLPRHLHLFTPRALRALAQSAGFGKSRMFTTVRESNNVFLGSRNIERTGRYIWGSAQPRLLKKTAKIMALMERVCIAFSGFVGEELVLIAER